jgi:serine/threonine protein kinase
MRESSLAKATLFFRDQAVAAEEDPHQGSFSKVLWKKDPARSDEDVVLKLVDLSSRAETRRHYHREVSAMLAARTTTAAKHLPELYGTQCLDNAENHPLLSIAERKRYAGWGVLTMRAGYSTIEKILPHVVTPIASEVLAYRLAIALADLHAAGISHQDLKLENVLVTSRSASDDQLSPLQSILDQIDASDPIAGTPGGPLEPSRNFTQDDEWLFGCTSLRLIDLGFSVVHSGCEDIEFLGFSRSIPRNDFRIPTQLLGLEPRDPLRLKFYQHVGHVTRNHRPGIFSGTPVAASPERLHCTNKNLPPKAYHQACLQDDVWALGVCIFELILGRSPQFWFEKMYADRFPKGLDFDEFRKIAPNTGRIAVGLCEEMNLSTDWCKLFSGVFEIQPSLRWTARQVVESDALARVRAWHLPSP